MDRASYPDDFPWESLDIHEKMIRHGLSARSFQGITLTREQTIEARRLRLANREYAEQCLPFLIEENLKPHVQEVKLLGRDWDAETGDSALGHVVSYRSSNVQVCSQGKDGRCAPQNKFKVYTPTFQPRSDEASTIAGDPETGQVFSQQYRVDEETSTFKDWTVVDSELENHRQSNQVSRPSQIIEGVPADEIPADEAAALVDLMEGL